MPKKCKTLDELDKIVPPDWKKCKTLDKVDKIVPPDWKYAEKTKQLNADAAEKRML